MLFDNPPPATLERCVLECRTVSVETRCSYSVTETDNISKGNNESSLTTSFEYLKVHCITDRCVVVNLLLTTEGCNTRDRTPGTQCQGRVFGSLNGDRGSAQFLQKTAGITYKIKRRSFPFISFRVHNSLKIFRFYAVFLS